MVQWVHGGEQARFRSVTGAEVESNTTHAEERFKDAMAAANACMDPPDWVRLANDFGFADQPHLVRAFKAFSRLSPTLFMEDPSHPIANVGFLQDK